jgi:hypothetical protein
MIDVDICELLPGGIDYIRAATVREWLPAVAIGSRPNRFLTVAARKDASITRNYN